MSNRFMMSVAAAALIAGTGFVYAQGSGSSGPSSSGGSTAQQSGPSGGSTAQQSGSSGGSATSPSANTPDATKPSSGMKATQSDQKAPGGQKSNSMTSDDKAGAKTNSAQSKEGMSKEGMSKDGTSKDGMNSAQTKSGSSDSKTTGNAATSATAAPPAEKRTQITSAFKQEKIEETTSVNFNVSVGAVIPGSVRFYPIPSRIVEIYPEWRGYDVIRVHGRYIIVRPQTHEIVYIIEG